jgi:hypothetical protein
MRGKLQLVAGFSYRNYLWRKLTNTTCEWYAVSRFWDVGMRFLWEE